MNGNEEREGGESYLNANTDPAQIVLIVKRERGSMALIYSLYQTRVVSLCGVFMIFSLIID